MNKLTLTVIFLSFSLLLGCEPRNSPGIYQAYDMEWPKDMKWPEIDESLEKRNASDFSRYDDVVNGFVVFTKNQVPEEELLEFGQDYEYDLGVNLDLDLDLIVVDPKDLLFPYVPVESRAHDDMKESVLKLVVSLKPECDYVVGLPSGLDFEADGYTVSLCLVKE